MTDRQTYRQPLFKTARRTLHDTVYHFMWGSVKNAVREVRNKCRGK